MRERLIQILAEVETARALRCVLEAAVPVARRIHALRVVRKYREQYE